jgi:hypothetical protein
MDALESRLRDLCLISPHWMQLELQAFWYGLISWLLTCVEDKRIVRLEDITVKELLEHADAEFTSWPTDWLESHIKDFLRYDFNEEQLNVWFGRLDTIFRDCVPTDLDIFTTLADGQSLTEEQWVRLNSTIAFIPPDIVKRKNTKGKTRRTHGRRALTPMRGRRALTHHKPYAQVVKLGN